MSRIDLRNIEKKPGVCGGRAVVVGTRIRVKVIVVWHRMGIPPEEIVSYYPGLRLADVYDALAYAADHPDEIEADIAADSEEEIQRLFPGGKGLLRP